MRFILLIFIILTSLLSFTQTPLTFPALSTNNAFTGSNSYTQEIEATGGLRIGANGFSASLLINGSVSGACALNSNTSGSVLQTACPISFTGGTQTLAGTLANGNIILSPNGTGKVQISNITGSTQCVQIDTTGQITGTGSPCPSGGTGTTGTFPLWTSPSVVGNSVLTNTSSPAGVNYNLGGGSSWQIDASHLTWNVNSIAQDITVANTFVPASSNNSGGIIIKGANATGSACSGGVSLNGGTTNGASNGAVILAVGGCSNGFGAIGSDINLTAGSTTASNNGGSINLSPGGTTGGGGVVNGVVSIKHGINGANGFQHLRLNSCATAATAGSTCTTTITWARAFDDANYTAVCNIGGGTGAVTGTPYLLNTSSRTSTQIVVTIVNLTAVISSGNLSCIGVHD